MLVSGTNANSLSIYYLSIYSLILEKLLKAEAESMKYYLSNENDLAGNQEKAVSFLYLDAWLAIDLFSYHLRW